jgi:hypothetical protein
VKPGNGSAIEHYAIVEGFNQAEYSGGTSNRKYQSPKCSNPRASRSVRQKINNQTAKLRKYYLKTIPKF